MPDLPLIAVTVAIWAYWARVGAMVVRARRREHHGVGLVPERLAERLMWLAIVPVVGAWMAFPLLALTRPHGAFALPAFARDETWYAALRWVAAAAAVACLLATLRAWRA